jgi:hypothetical protein
MSSTSCDKCRDDSGRDEAGHDDQGSDLTASTDAENGVRTLLDAAGVLCKFAA